MGLAIAGIAAGVLGAGASAYGASQTPKPGSGARQSTRETAQGTLQGYAQTAPLSYGLSSIYQPAYLGLGSQNLEQLLFGSQARTVNQNIGWGKLGADGNWSRNASVQQEIPGSAGLFDIIGRASPQLQSLYQTGARQGVQNQLGLLNEFLPQAQQYSQNANPQLMELQRLLGVQANQGLNMGSRWNPADLGRETSRIRSDWANRGLGSGQSAQMDEILQILGGGEALRNQRQNFALNANQSLSATQPDYLRMILGLGGNPVGDAMSFVTGQQPLSYQGNSFDPYNATAAQAGIAGMNTATAAALSNRDLYSGLGGGLLNMGGDLLGQYYSNKNSKPGTGA